MAGRRAERVSRQVVQTLAAIAESEVHDPRLHGLTFTSANATDDLRTVRVYYSILGGDASTSDAAQEGLKAANGFLRRELAHRLSLRYVPSLIFEYDQSILTAERIERLLRDDRPKGPATDDGGEEGSS